MIITTEINMEKEYNNIDELQLLFLMKPVFVGWLKTLSAEKMPII